MSRLMFNFNEKNNRNFYFAFDTGISCNCKGANCWRLCGTTVGTCTSYENRKWNRLLYNRNLSSQVSAVQIDF